MPAPQPSPLVLLSPGAAGRPPNRWGCRPHPLGHSLALEHKEKKGKNKSRGSERKTMNVQICREQINDDQ